MDLQYNTNNLELLHPEIGVWRIKQFFSAQLLDFIERKILTQPFELREYYQIGDVPLFSELVQQTQFTGMLEVFLQDETLIRAMAEATHLPQLKGTKSRVYKFLPGSKNSFGWHKDLEDSTRKLGFSVNLSKHGFEGGPFMIRKVHDHSVHFEFQNIGYGDAIFFRIGEELEHCVPPITGDKERIACAGWFIDQVVPIE